MTDRLVQSAVPSLDVRNVDIWAAWAEGHTIAIMTNGVVRRGGLATMGQGTAFEAARKFPELPRRLGTSITEHGNRLFYFPEWRLVTFPTKDVYWKRASLQIITRSAWELSDGVRKGRIPSPVWLPLPGCGYHTGGLCFESVPKSNHPTGAKVCFVLGRANPRYGGWEMSRTGSCQVCQKCGGDRIVSRFFTRVATFEKTLPCLCGAAEEGVAYTSIFHVVREYREWGGLGDGGSWIAEDEELIGEHEEEFSKEVVCAKCVNGAVHAEFTTEGTEWERETEEEIEIACEDCGDESQK